MNRPSFIQYFATLRRALCQLATVGRVASFVERPDVRQLPSKGAATECRPNSEHEGSSGESATAYEVVLPPSEVAVVFKLREDDDSCFGPRPEGDAPLIGPLLETKYTGSMKSSIWSILI